MPKYVEQSVWVPKAQRDTRYYLWYECYMCQLPYINLVSEEDVKLFGSPISGDPMMDKTLSSELRTLMLPIVTMAEYFGEGAHVAVSNYADTEKIYKRITDHLQAWKNRIATSLNLGDVPFDDLLLLDRFANAVYDKAKYAFTEQYFSSVLKTLGGSHHQASLFDMLSKVQNAPLTLSMPQNTGGYGQPVQKPEKEYPKRQGFEEFLNHANRGAAVSSGGSLNTGGHTQMPSTSRYSNNDNGGGALKKVPSLSELLGGKF